MAKREVNNPMLVAITLAVVLCIKAVECQEKPQDWPASYYVGPYKHIYPPTEISVDQKACRPEPDKNVTCPLFVELITSFGGSFVSSGIVPAIQVALDQINSRPDILPGYTLHYALLDSQCDHTMSLDALHAGLLSPPTKIAVVGSGCSVATEPAAEISHYYNLTQVSCTSASIELSNRRRFRKHFQHFPADISLAYGFFGIIMDSSWRKVTLVVEDAFLFTRTMDELKRLLMARNIEYREISYTQDIDPFMGDTDSRIYVLSMYPPFARQILCKAYNWNKNFKYPQGLFLVNGWYPDNWWEGNMEEQAMLKKMFNCDAEQRKSLIPYSLSILSSGMVVVNYSAVADNGVTGDQMRKMYYSYLAASRLNVSEVFLYQLCYDAIWTLARALNDTINDLQTDSDFINKLRPFGAGKNITFGLQDFDYNNSIVAENIYQHLSQTNFNGIVGNIAFNENGSRRVDKAEIRQFRFVDDDQTLQPVLIGEVHWNKELIFTVTYFNSTDSIWPDGITYDGVATEIIVSVHPAVTGIFAFLATGGLLFAVLCIICNIYFRNKTLIRLTSPYLNCLIGVGAIILYLNMYINIIPSFSTTAEIWLCNLDEWFIAIGYSLCYGIIVAKMCRVYYIFSIPSTNKRPLTDWKLALFVMLLVVIDIVILFTHSLVDGIRGQLIPNRIPNRENFEIKTGVLQETYQHFIYVCNSESRYITLGVLYGYKVLLQIVALVLAVSIRKVHIKGLNDAKYIIAAIYVTSIVTTVVVVSTYTLLELPNVYAVVFSLCLFIGTTVILILVFIPPIIGLIKDPDGTLVFQEKPDSHKGSIVLSDKESDTIIALKQRIQELEQTLKNKSK